MKTIQTLMLGGAAIVLAAGGIALGYWLHPKTGETQPASVMASAERLPPGRKPLYYQDPDGKADYSPTPKKSAAGRDYVPVYDAATGALPPAPDSGAKGRVLYYRNPMGLADTSPVPKKDAMGMDYIAVYEGEGDSGVVTVSPQRVQMLGVRTVPVEVRSSLTRSIRATGTIQADESKLAIVSTKFDVVVEKLLVSTTGARVRAGQPLAHVWMDTPDTMMQRGPDVITRQINYIVALQDKNPVTIAQTENVLRQYGIPEAAIAEIRRTGHATRELTIVAPRSGTILEKQAVEGMRINTGEPLFKIADLSSVWLMADVQEQDLGAVQLGRTAQIAFVAFPGRTFAGTVSFIYPTLMANTRTGRVRIVLANPDGLLRESMYATVLFNTAAGASEQILVVPDSAVIDSGTRQVVVVARGEGKFEPRAVRVGVHGDGHVQVLDGLRPGEQVVVSANFLIDAESNLRAALQGFAPVGKKSSATP